MRANARKGSPPPCLGVDLAGLQEFRPRDPARGLEICRHAWLDSVYFACLPLSRTVPGSYRAQLWRGG
jgi:hypothetical protein